MKDAYEGLCGLVHKSGVCHQCTGLREASPQGQRGEPIPDLSGDPDEDHISDGIGEEILGEESQSFWHDHKSAKINAIRTRNHIEAADVVVVRFGEKYKQWNAAFDAGYAAALGKPLIVIHAPEHEHALKEVDAAAFAVAERPEQVVEILRYCLQQI